MKESVPPASAAALQQFQAIQKTSQSLMYSRRPFHEVEIPLFFKDDHPYLKVSWSGQPIACVVDTGAGLTSWPQWLHLDTQQLHISGRQTWTSGVITKTEWMLTPRIEIGDMVLINVPTKAIGFPKPAPSDPFPMSLASPILGMHTFTPFVLTIDYRGKRLLLRDSHYDVTRLPHSARSQLIPYKGDQYGRVVLPGMLAGHKATFLLDTGCPRVYVSSSFAQKYLSFVPNEADFRNGVLPSLPNLSFTVSGLAFQGLEGNVMNSQGGPDVALGLPFFWRYRVTIDRFRGVVLLEKTDEDKQGMKLKHNRYSTE